jgi:6-phosphofructokinase 1
MKKVAILCSGGDSQGMNVCIKVFTNYCKRNNIVPIGIKRGFQGLIDNDFVDLREIDVQIIDRVGGSIIKSSRCKDFKTPQGVKKAVDNINKNEIDGVIVCGGDGSFRGVLALMGAGVKVMGIPCTIDNDLFYTARSIGFDTAVTQATKVIDDVMQTMTTNNRGVVVKVMGRGCGDIALQTAVTTLAHSLAVKELNSTMEGVLLDVKNAIDKGVESPIVVVSENVEFDETKLAEYLEKETGKEFRFIDVGYLARGGAPSVFDRFISTRYTIYAVDLLIQQKTGYAMAVQNNEIVAINVEEVYNYNQEFDMELVNYFKELNQ